MTLVTFALVSALGVIARADQRYTVSGKDSFAIGASDIRSEVSYAGSESLKMTHHGKVTRYKAHVVYTRSDGTAASDATSDYTADVLPTGEARDTADRDPDYLTVLNQPFSAQLDRQTLADLQHLQGALPFDFPSPFTGSSLHGYLRHIGNAMMGPHRSIGVRFESTGTMKGALPDRPGLTLTGTIAMRGTAYYDLDSALLLALDTTVTITGNVSNRSSNEPVTIVYARTLRADVPHTAQSARKP